MSQGYFKHIPNINYDFKSDGKLYQAKDLFSKVSVWSYLQEGVSGYNYYRITDGESPDATSARLYGDSTLYWTFFLVNENLQDFNDWPKSQQVLHKFIARKYSGTVLVAPNSTDIISYDHSKNDDEQSDSRKFELGDKVSQSSSGAFGFVTKVDPTNNRIVLNSVTGTFTNNARVLGVLPTITFHSLDGDGTTTTLSINKTQSTGTILEIYVDNILQNESSYSTVLTPNNPTSKTTIIFNTAPADKVKVNVFERKSFVLSSVADEKDVVNHYIDSNELKTTVEAQNTPVSNEKYERDLNEEQYLIRYIEPKYIGDVVSEFKEMIRD